MKYEDIKDLYKQFAHYKPARVTWSSIIDRGEFVRTVIDGQIVFVLTADDYLSMVQEVHGWNIALDQLKIILHQKIKDKFKDSVRYTGFENFFNEKDLYLTNTL